MLHTHETTEHVGRRCRRRDLRIEGDALAGSHPVHPPRQDLARNRLPDGQGRNLPADPAPAESGHLRHDLHGRLRHAADERGDQRQLHRRNGVSARGRHVRPLHQHPGQPLELARKGRMEGRSRRHRVVRGLHAGRCGRLAALARPPQGRRGNPTTSPIW